MDNQSIELSLNKALPLKVHLLKVSVLQCEISQIMFTKKGMKTGISCYHFFSLNSKVEKIFKNNTVLLLVILSTRNVIFSTRNVIVNPQCVIQITLYVILSTLSVIFVLVSN